MNQGLLLLNAERFAIVDSFGKVLQLYVYCQRFEGKQVVYYFDGILVLIVIRDLSGFFLELSSFGQSFG